MDPTQNMDYSQPTPVQNQEQQGYVKPESSGPQSHNPLANLIVNYLPQSLTDDDFYKMFSVVGQIKNCRIMRDLKTHYSFGFGFVEYVSEDDAAKAILQMNNAQVLHKRVKVSYARPPGEDIKDSNLYIQNIPRNYTVEQLEELFAPFGNIVQKNILKDKITGMPRGVGFVRYDTKANAEAAILAMNGTTLPGGSEALVVKVAEEHGKMKAAYYAGLHAGMGIRGGRGRGSSFVQRGGMQGMGRGNYGMAGKMGSDRSHNRFNPMAPGGGGGYYNSGGAMGGSTGYEFTTPSFGSASTNYSVPPPYLGGGNSRF